MEMLSIVPQFQPLHVSIICFPFFIYFLIKLLSSSPNISKNLPPSPSKIPILGNLHQLGVCPHRSLASLAQRYGPLMLLHFGSKPVLVVSSVEAAREILKTHDVVFGNKPKLSIMDKLLYGSKIVASSPYGEYWRHMKSILVHHLLTNKRVESFRIAREEEVNSLIEKIRESSSLLVNLSQMFTYIANDVTCRVAFGKKYSGEDGDKFHKMLREMFKLLGVVMNIGEFIPWLSWINRLSGFDAKAYRIAKEFDQVIDGIVEDHITNIAVGDEGPKDFVHVLLELQMEHSNNDEAEFKLQRENIKALIMDMFVGGTATSSVVLEWTMTELIRHPRVMKKLRNEIKAVSAGKSNISEADLDQLHYGKLVIKEALRLRMPFPFSGLRESMQDIEVLGCHIPARTWVIVNAWALSRDSTIWSNPEEFWPERFLNSNVDFKGHDFQFLPFGAGRRGCPGISFSLPVIELVLANLINNFEWELPGGIKGQDLDVDEAIGLNITRKNPLLAIPIPISHHQ